jgi:hypothetical protein
LNDLGGTMNGFEIGLDSNGNSATIVARGGYKHNTNATTYTNTARQREEPAYCRRDVIILTHKQAEGTINLYQCSPWTISPIKQVLAFNNDDVVNSTLTIGARKNSLDTVSNYGSGIIYDCKL